MNEPMQSLEQSSVNDDPQPIFQAPIPSHRRYPSIKLLIGFGLAFITIVNLYLFIENRAVQRRQIVQTATTPSTKQKDDTIPKDWRVWEDTSGRFSLHYPPSYQLRSDNGGMLDQIISLEKSTTFERSVLRTQSQFLLQKRPTTTAESACTKESSDAIPLTHTERIGNQTWYYTDSYGGGAAGTHDTNIQYTTYFNQTCIEASLIFFESSDWNDPNDTTLAASEKIKVFSELRQMLSTFRMNPSGTSRISPPLQSTQAAGLIVGINTSICCGCPTQILSNQVGRDGWRVYEKGVNYAQFLPEQCTRVDCKPCESLQ